MSWKYKWIIKGWKDMNFEGKKLLVLGGLMRTTFLIQRAKKQGAYVIVADLDIDSPGKRIADESVLINCLDVDAVTKMAEEKQVDGIISAHTDLLLQPWFEVADRLNLPCYLTEDMIKVSTDKEEFGEMCTKYGVPVPKVYNIDENRLEEEAQNLKYPVFIKPLDGSGSRGAAACERKEDFIELYYNAKKYSSRGKVIVEEKLHGTDIGVDYLIVDGEAYQISMHDRQICEGRATAVNHSNLQILPSKHLGQYRDGLDEKVRFMLKDMGFKNGIVFFQGFANEEGIKFFEMGCRLGSTWNYIDEYFQGFNPIDALISHALTGGMVETEMLSGINPAFNGYGAVVSLLTEKKDTYIKSVKGIRKLNMRKEIKCIMQNFAEGDCIAFAGADTSLVRMQIATDSFDDLLDTIRYVYDEVDYYDENNNSIIAEKYDIRLLEYERN